MFLKKIRNNTKKISIRLRLTLLFAVIFGLSLFASGYATVRFLADSLQKEFDDALYNYAVDVTESITLDAEGDLALLAPRVDRQKIYPFSLGTALIQVRHRSGRVLEQVGEFGDLQLPYKLDVQRLALGEDPSYRTLNKLEGLPTREAESYRVISISIDTAVPPELILQIAVPMTLLENQIANRKVVLGFGIPVIVVLASLMAYILSARALRPVRAMIRQSQAIEATNLSQRLPIPPAQDEVRELAITLNQMIERLEKAFHSQERFIADASHQLLTPLTILKGELEQSLRSGKGSGAVGTAATAEGPGVPGVSGSGAGDGTARGELPVQSLLQEVDRLTKLVQDLLLLARVDAGVGALTLSEVDLEEVVFDAVRKVEKMARPRGIRMSFHIRSGAGNTRDNEMGTGNRDAAAAAASPPTPAPAPAQFDGDVGARYETEAEADHFEDISTERRHVHGDIDLLFHLVFNLLENAVKYSSDNSQVVITVEETKRGTHHVIISDSGPGLDEDEFESIFERFRRGRPKHGQTRPGYGLGLAIAQQIARVHNGSLWVENRMNRDGSVAGASFHFEIKNF